MIIEPPDLNRVFAEGSLHDFRHIVEGHVATVRIMPCGELLLPSGRLVAADPWAYRHEAPRSISQRVIPGSYPVEVIVADFHDLSFSPCIKRFSEVAAARLVVRREPITTWAMALVDGQTEDNVTDLGHLGYPVDGGVGSFGSFEVFEALGDDSAQDLRAVIDRLGHEGAGVYLEPATGHDLALFCSGEGDGSYLTWVGYTSSGQVGCFVTDFGTLTTLATSAEPEAAPEEEPADPLMMPMISHSGMAPLRPVLSMVPMMAMVEPEQEPDEGASADVPAAEFDDQGYPSWVTALADEHLCVTLYVVRGLESTRALELVGARAHQIRPVELPSGLPSSEWSSLVMGAVGVEPGAGSALIAGQVGDWTFVYDSGGLTEAYDMAGDGPLARLSSDGREAASCSHNIESDTRLAYAVDGHELFSIGEPVSECQPDELPDGLRHAAEAAEIDWSGDDDDDDHDWSPAENFRVVCVLADLQLTLDNIRTLPLLGAAFG